MLVTKVKFKGSQMQNQAQEDLIRDISCSADSIGLKVYMSLILIEHCPSHLN
jgi:hypothetical protein